MKYTFLEEKYNNKYNKYKFFEYDQFDDEDEEETDDILNNIDQEKIKEINYLLRDKKEIFDIISAKKYSDDEVKKYLEYNKISYDKVLEEVKNNSRYDYEFNIFIDVKEKQLKNIYPALTQLGIFIL